MSLFTKRPPLIPPELEEEYNQALDRKHNADQEFHKRKALCRKEIFGRYIAEIVRLREQE